MGMVNKHQEVRRILPTAIARVRAPAYIGLALILALRGPSCASRMYIRYHHHDNMPTKALQRLGRLPAPGPKIKKDPKSKLKPKLKITASSRVTRQTSLSRSDLPPPEAPSRASAKRRRARAASSPFTSPVPSSSDSPRSDDIVELRVAGSEVVGSEVAELIARCEREETEIDRLLVEIESQCSDE